MLVRIAISSTNDGEAIFTDAYPEAYATACEEYFSPRVYADFSQGTRTVERSLRPYTDISRSRCIIGVTPPSGGVEREFRYTPKQSEDHSSEIGSRIDHFEPTGKLNPGPDQCVGAAARVNGGESTT